MATDDEIENALIRARRKLARPILPWVTPVVEEVQAQRKPAGLDWMRYESAEDIKRRLAGNGYKDDATRVGWAPQGKVEIDLPPDVSAEQFGIWVEKPKSKKKTEPKASAIEWNRLSPWKDIKREWGMWDGGWWEFRDDCIFCTPCRRPIDNMECEQRNHTKEFRSKTLGVPADKFSILSPELILTLRCHGRETMISNTRGAIADTISASNWTGR